jgi:hypothetical protein
VFSYLIINFDCRIMAGCGVRFVSPDGIVCAARYWLPKIDCPIAADVAEGSVDLGLAIHDRPEYVPLQKLAI